MKNSLIKVLSFLMALTMIVGCFSAITFSAAECTTHTKGEVVTKVDATCGHPGYTTYECSVCSAQFTTDWVATLKDHTGIETIPASDATCSMPAMTAGVACKDCGVVIENREVVADSKPLGHKWVKEHSGNTCTLALVSKCVTCGQTAEEAFASEKANKELQALYTSYTPAGWTWATYKLDEAAMADKDLAAKEIGAGHTWVYTVEKAPEKCVDGVTVATCKVCEESAKIVIAAVHGKAVAYKSCDAMTGTYCEDCKNPLAGAEENPNPEHTYVTAQSLYDNRTNVALPTDFYSSIEKLGCTDQTLAKPSNCEEEGYVVKYCTECGTYVKEVTEKSDHTMTDWTDKNGSFAPSATFNPDVCITAKVQWSWCSTCEDEATYVERTLIEASQHNTISVVVPASCGVEGYTLTWCTNGMDAAHYANETLIAEAYDQTTNTIKDTTKWTALVAKAYKNNYTTALQHNWVLEETVGSTTDHTAVYKNVYECTICGNTNDEILIPANPTAPAGTVKGFDGHYYIVGGSANFDVYVPATCTYPEYKAYQCKVPGCTHTVPVSQIKTDGTQNGTREAAIALDKTGDTLASWTSKKAADHELSKRGAKITQLSKAPTCTADGVDTYYCGCNPEAYYEVVVSNEGLHGSQTRNWVAKDGKGLDASTDNSNKTSYAAKTATCTKTGLTEGVVCALCNKVIKAQETTPIDPNYHWDYKNNTKATETFVTTVAATCSTPTITTTKWVCCGKSFVTYGDAAVANSHKLGAVVPAVPAACGKDGSVAYQECEYCGIQVTPAATPVVGIQTVQAGNILTTIIVPALQSEHTWKYFKYDADAAQVAAGKEGYAYPETCTVDGTTEYRECTKCQTKEGYAVLPAHGTKYQVVYANTGTTAATIALGYNVAPTHTEDGIWAGTFCEKCGNDYSTTGQDGKYLIKALGHDAKTTANVTYVNDPASEKYDCTKPSYYVFECSCGYQEVLVGTHTVTGILGTTFSFAAAKKEAHEMQVEWTTLTRDDRYVFLNGKKIFWADADKKAWGTTETAYPVNACEIELTSYRSCKTAGCSHKEYDEAAYKAPVTHFYINPNDPNKTERVNMYLDCLNIEDARGQECAWCGLAVTAETPAQHNYIYSVQEATCTENGYRVYFCTLCNERPKGEFVSGAFVPAAPSDENATEIFEEIPALGFKPYTLVNGDGVNAPANWTPDATGVNLYAINSAYVTYVVEEQASTKGANGFIKYMCAKCGEIHTFEYNANTGIELDMVATPGYTGATVEVQILASAVDYKFQSLTFEVTHGNGFAIAEEGVVLNPELFPAADAVTLRYSANNGNITMTVYAPTAADGTAVNTTITGAQVVLATVYLKVLPYANTRDTLGLAVKELVAINEKGEAVKYDTLVADTDPQYITNVVNVGTSIVAGKLDKYAANIIGDLNGDDYIDGTDTLQVMSSAYKAEYNSAIDFNGDGEITLADYVAVMQYTLSDRTYADFLVLIGVDYMDAVNAYQLNVDVDRDYKVTENDKALIAFYLAEDLAHMTVENIANVTRAMDLNTMIKNIVTDLSGDYIRDYPVQ